MKEYGISSSFIRILEFQDLRLSDTANWYIAMAYLKEGKVAEAREALFPLVENANADRYEEAKELVNSFDELDIR